MIRRVTVYFVRLSIHFSNSYIPHIPSDTPSLDLEPHDDITDEDLLAAAALLESGKPLIMQVLSAFTSDLRALLLNTVIISIFAIL